MNIVISIESKFFNFFQESLVEFKNISCAYLPIKSLNVFLKKNQPDIIIIQRDLMVKKSEMEIFFQRSFDTYIIYFTGRKTQSSLEHFFQEGAKDILFKKCDFIELKRTLNKAFYEIHTRYTLSPQKIQEVIQKKILPQEMHLYLEITRQITENFLNYLKYFQKFEMGRKEFPPISSMKNIYNDALFFEIPEIFELLDKLQLKAKNIPDSALKEIKRIEKIINNFLKAVKNLISRENKNIYFENKNNNQKIILVSKDKILLENLNKKVQNIEIKMIADFNRETVENLLKSKPIIVDVDFFKNQKIDLEKLPYPALAITEIALREDQDFFLKQGFENCISKKFSSEEIHEALFSLLKKTDTLSDQSTIKNDETSILLLSENNLVVTWFSEIFESYNCVVAVIQSSHELSELYNSYFAAIDLVVIDSHSEHYKTKNIIKNIFMLNSRQMCYIIGPNSQEFFKEALENKFTNMFQWPPNSYDFKKRINALKSTLYEQDLQINQEMKLFKEVDSHLISDPQNEGLNKNISVWHKYFNEVGGDMFYCKKFNSHKHAGIILADVCGHDMQSSYLATWFSGLVSGLWASQEDPLDTLKQLQKSFPKQRGLIKRFICVLILDWDPVRGIIRYANAGIPNAAIISKEVNDYKFRWTDWESPPIGMFDDESDFSYGQIKFTGDSRFYLATDGLFDAKEEKEIIEMCCDSMNLDLTASARELGEYFKSHNSAVDDMTLVCLDANNKTDEKYTKHYSFKSTLIALDKIMLQVEKYLKENVKFIVDAELLFLAIREALLNACEHGNKNKPDKYVDLDLILTPYYLEVIVSDQGAGFDLEKAQAQVMANENSMKIGGRGLRIISEIAESIECNGSSLHIILKQKR